MSNAAIKGHVASVLYDFGISSDEIFKILIALSYELHHTSHEYAEDCYYNSSWLEEED